MNLYIRKYLANGNNLGAKLARGEFLFIINPDVVLSSDCINNLYNFDVRFDNYICMPQILMEDGKKINTLGNKLNYLGISWCGDYLASYENFNFNKKKATRIFFPSGAALFLRKETFMNLGGYNELFFMYLEDTDLGLQAFKQECKIFLVNNAVVYHKYEYSKNPIKFYHYEKNRLILLIENFSFKTLVLISIPLLIMEAGMIVYFIGMRQLSYKINSYKFIILD